MVSAPKISVLMSVYNAGDELKDSVEGILNQTYSDFEFIIINDGSTNNNREILENYAAQDSRIRLINQENTGLTKALNNGIKLARGKYIARQDADDISYPNRFELQMELMDGDSSIVLCGGNCDDLYEDGSSGVWGTYDSDILQKIVFFKTPFAHSTAMMRADICKELGGYDESFKTSQDMEFWMRFALKGRLAMVSTPIIQRKIMAGSISNKRRLRQFYDATRARMKYNKGLNRIYALYYAVRSFIINLLPIKLVKILKNRKP